MATWTALTHIAGKASAEALVTHAEETLDPLPFGTGIFEIEDGSDRWEVGLFFSERPNDIILSLLGAAHQAEPFALSEVPDVDWVAHVKRELTPVEAGRFFIYGSHDKDRVPEDAEGLCIDAAMAFGTGHHDTTKGCLEAIDELADDPDFDPVRIVDIGCGTGVLAMAAARVWPHVVLAGDMDPIAVDTARANVLANGLDGRVEVVEAAGFGHPVIENSAPFDLVLANILKQPLIDLAPDMAKMIAHGGIAVLSGLMVDQAEAVTTAYLKQGFEIYRRDDLFEWTTLQMRKP